MKAPKISLTLTADQWLLVIRSLTVTADPEVLVEFQAQRDSALAMEMSALEPVRKEVLHGVCDKPTFRRWFDQHEAAGSGRAKVRHGQR